jgi:glycerol kinase
MKKYIMSIDQGTTSTRTIIYNFKGDVTSLSQKEIVSTYPNIGYVNQNAEDIWISVLTTMTESIRKAHIDPKEIASIGITNQRETTIIWDKRTGKPIGDAIVWQSRQSQSICQELINQGHKDYIHHVTGLIIDPYFSATKIAWILRHVKGARKLADEGHLLFGTVDSYIMFKLTGNHVTDYSNASRTMLFDIHKLVYDEKILNLLDIPASMLPNVMPSVSVFGYTLKDHFFGYEIPIGGIAGDQQASLFGHMAYKEGMVKNTYGTGCFLLMQTGEKPIFSKHGLLTTIAWGYDNKLYYALEGSVFIGGSVIQWLRDGLNLFEDAKKSEELANQLPSNEGVYMVPAFVGLGAPYWDSDIKGAIFGLTRGTNQTHLARAALESICYQVEDVLDVMKNESGLSLSTLKVDGGATKNEFLMQFQADISRTKIEKPIHTESTAFGVFLMAGLSVGIFKDLNDIASLYKVEKTYQPDMDMIKVKKYKEEWHKAIQATQLFK